MEVVGIQSSARDVAKAIHKMIVTVCNNNEMKALQDLLTTAHIDKVNKVERTMAVQRYSKTIATAVSNSPFGMIQYVMLLDAGIFVRDFLPFFWFYCNNAIMIDKLTNIFDEMKKCYKDIVDLHKAKTFVCVKQARNHFAREENIEQLTIAVEQLYQIVTVEQKAATSTSKDHNKNIPSNINIIAMKVQVQQLIKTVEYYAKHFCVVEKIPENIFAYRIFHRHWCTLNTELEYLNNLSSKEYVLNVLDSNVRASSSGGSHGSVKDDDVDSSKESAKQATMDSETHGNVELGLAINICSNISVSTSANASPNSGSVNSYAIVDSADGCSHGVVGRTDFRPLMI